MKSVNLRHYLLFTMILWLAFLVSCSSPTTTTLQPTLTALPDTNTPIPPTQTASPIPPTPTKTPIPHTATPTRLPTRTPKLATSANDIVGIWLGIENSAGMYFQFNEDGTCKQAKTRTSLDTQPNVECIFTFDGSQLVITEVSIYDLPECGSNLVVYQVHLLANKQIDFIKIKDSCGPRVNTIAQVHEQRP